MTGIAMSFLTCFLAFNLAVASEERGTANADPQHRAVAAADFQVAPLQLEAEGPGALFPSAEAAAIDALTYAYLQARDAGDPEYLRGGTIHPVGEDHYSYGEIQRAKSWSRNRIRYTLKPRDVARFHLYPVYRDGATNRSNEIPTQVDLRSVEEIDPLHRPLYILHPSLTVRGYRGESSHPVEVATLRCAARSRFFAGECSSQESSVGALAGSSRIAESSRRAPCAE